MMRTILFIILSSLIISLPSYAKDSDQMTQFVKSKWELKNEIIQQVINGDIIVDTEVETIDKEQKFAMKAIGLHPKSCARVLRKLSRYEEFSNWIPYIKKSKYNEANKLITIHADHFLLPFPMLVHIIIDRTNKEGDYPFVFPTGIFLNLKGTVSIREFNNRCLFFSESKWRGKHTGINDLVIEIFATTLSKIGAEMLVRKTQF